MRAGCERMLTMLNDNGCSHIINDNRKVPGTWSEAVEWLSENWFPRMEKAGLRNFAWIYSPSTFSQLSASKSVELKTDKIITRLFLDAESAEAWLNDLAN